MPPGPLLVVEPEQLTTELLANVLGDPLTVQASACPIAANGAISASVKAVAGRQAGWLDRASHATSFRVARVIFIPSVSSSKTDSLPDSPPLRLDRRSSRTTVLRTRR